MVSAFAAEKQLVLGEIVTDEKSNEITAVPEILESLNIENSIVTADAMSGQKEIVRKIWEEGKDHGRIGKRDDRLLTDLSCLTQQTEWSGLQAAGSVTAAVTRDNKTTTDTRYFLTSAADVERFAYAVRKHWAMENHLHWCLDVTSDGDSSRARKDMSPRTGAVPGQ